MGIHKILKSRDRSANLAGRPARRLGTICGCDRLGCVGGRDFIDATKNRGTKAGHSFDDPASHREPPCRGDDAVARLSVAPYLAI